MSFNRSTELISINSEAEQEFVLRELKDMRISQVWLGLNDRKVEGRYEWSDKSPVTYKNWEAKEPATGVVARLSDCTIVDGNTQNGTWSTSPCFFRRGYICKRKIGKRRNFVIMVTDESVKYDRPGDSDHDFGCRNVSQCHYKQSVLGLHSPGRSYFTIDFYDSWVLTIITEHNTPV